LNFGIEAFKHTRASERFDFGPWFLPISALS
jgi:hypothetical protein